MLPSLSVTGDCESLLVTENRFIFSLRKIYCVERLQHLLIASISRSLTSVPRAFFVPFVTLDPTVSKRTSL